MNIRRGWVRLLSATVIPLGLMVGACGSAGVEVQESALNEPCPPPPCPDECLKNRTSTDCLKLLTETGAECPPPPTKKHCNQGVGNGPEGCDPGNSNNQNSSNDENGGVPGEPGRQGPK